MRRLLLPAAATVALCACSGGNGDDSARHAPASSDVAATQSLFETEIAPILTSSCATCHLTGQEAGNLSLVPGKALASLIDIPSMEAPDLVRVVPGNPDRSYLVMKLEGTQIAHGGAGAQMPFGSPPLSPDKIGRFRHWIAEGAKP